VGYLVILNILWIKVKFHFKDLGFMKVCHVTSMHDWKDDRIFERACIGLAKSGVDTHLIAAPNMNHYVSDVGRKGNEKQTNINGVTIHWLRERKGWKRRLFSSIEASIKAVRLKMDIIHFHDPDLLLWIYLMSWKNTKVIYDVHENYSSRFYTRTYLGHWLPKKFARFYRLMELYFINRFNGVIFVTQSMAKLYHHSNPNELVIGNMPFLSALQELANNTGKFAETTFVTSGIISNARNAVNSIIALSLINPKPSFKLLFAGKYPEGYKEELKKVIEKYSLNDSVILEGMLPYLENFKRVSKAHVGCVFYQDNENNKIALPNRIFEYMYCGLAVIGDDFPELRAVIEEAKCGIVVDSSDRHALSNAYNRMIRDPGQIQRYGKNGQKAVFEKFNFEKMLSEMIDFYKRLLV